MRCNCVVRTVRANSECPSPRRPTAPILPALSAFQYRRDEHITGSLRVLSSCILGNERRRQTRSHNSRCEPRIQDMLRPSLDVSGPSGKVYRAPTDYGVTPRPPPWACKSWPARSLVLRNDTSTTRLPSASATLAVNVSGSSKTAQPLTGSGQAQQQRRFSILCPGATEMVGAPPRCGGGAFAILRKSRVADPCERRHTRKRNGGRRWSMRIRSGYMSSGPTKIEGLGNRSNLAITAKARLPDPEGNRGR